MRSAIAAMVLLICSSVPVFCQQQTDAATKEDVKQMLELTDSRARLQQLWAAMIQNMAATAAEAYKNKHPQATPDEVQRIAVNAAESMQKVVKVLSVDELIEAMIPIYQRYLTHADLVAINEFYASPTGEKLLKNSGAMMGESMQAAQAIIRKHIPDLEAAANEAAKPAEK